MSEALAARVEISTAYSADDQPASVLAVSGAAFGDFASHGVAGGNQRIAEELARSLRIELETPVQRVTWSERCVRMHERDFDACLIAVPATIAIDFDPPLPDGSSRRSRARSVRRRCEALSAARRAGRAERDALVPTVLGLHAAGARRAPLPVLAAFAGTAPASIG